MLHRPHPERGEFFDELFRRLAHLRDACAEREILAEPDIGPFRGLDRAEPAEMSGMQLPCCEILLACGERGDHSLQVAHGVQEIQALDPLRDALPSPHPVAGRHAGIHPLRQELVPDDHLDAGELPPLHDALEIVEHVADQHLEVDAEEVCQEIAAQLQPLVHVMVLVIDIEIAVLDQDVLLDVLAEVVRLEDALVPGDAQVRQEVLVHDVLGALLADLLGLGDADALGDEVQGILLALDVSVLAEVHDHLVELPVGGDEPHDLAVLGEAEGLDDDDDGDALDPGEREVEDAVLQLLQGMGDLERAFLGEHLAHIPAGADGCLLDEKLVGGQVLDVDQDALGPVDDEIAARVVGILVLGDEVVLVELVQVAVPGLEHDGQVGDLGGEGLPLDIVDVGAYINGDRGGIGELPNPCLHGEDVPLAAVRLDDLRLADLDIVELDLELLDVMGDDRGLDLLVLLDDRLEVMLDEIVERFDVRAHERIILEIVPDQRAGINHRRRSGRKRSRLRSGFSC